ncbi:MAG TPA: hypothetical protein PLU30_22160 [Verrucomicrobiae bacterium]|nr:hypothetical protein [Verrucomicrobiae bacterium]
MARIGMTFVAPPGMTENHAEPSSGVYCPRQPGASPLWTCAQSGPDAEGRVNL